MKSLLPQVQTFLGAELLSKQAHKSHVGWRGRSQDRDLIREVGTDPAGASNHGHNAVGI